MWTKKEERKDEISGILVKSDLHDAFYIYTGRKKRFQFREKIKISECRNDIMMLVNGSGSKRRGKGRGETSWEGVDGIDDELGLSTE